MSASTYALTLSNTAVKRDVPEPITITVKKNGSVLNEKVTLSVQSGTITPTSGTLSNGKISVTVTSTATGTNTIHVAVDGTTVSDSLSVTDLDYQDCKNTAFEKVGWTVFSNTCIYIYYNNESVYDNYALTNTSSITRLQGDDGMWYYRGELCGGVNYKVAQYDH